LTGDIVPTPTQALPYAVVVCRREVADERERRRSFDLEA